MTQYTVDATAVAVAATATRTSGQLISAEVTAMMHHLTTLAESWQGAAHTQFAAVADSWRVTQLQVEANLDAIGVALDTAAAQYTDAETATTRLFAM